MQHREEPSAGILEEEAAISSLLPPTAAHQLNGAPLLRLDWAFKASWAVNWFLLVAKLLAFILSHSKAVLASLADSGVDLASQLVLSLAEHFMTRKSPEYPVGRARLEALGVIGCAFIMSLASLEVIQYSASDLYAGFVKGEPLVVEAGPAMYIILGSGTGAKLLLYIYCNAFKSASDSVAALAEDHINDVFSNIGAIVTASIASHVRSVWWIDPVGAIVISAIIMWRWVFITLTQVKKIVGHSAPPEFIEQVRSLASAHSNLLDVDSIRAYHFGARYNIELEIVLPGDMTVSESHDLAMDLQHKIEALEEVERAFVHVDYLPREVPEHKVERNLMLDALKRRSNRSESGSALTELMGLQQVVTAV